MGKVELVPFVLVITLLALIPMLNAFTGNSTSYFVSVSELSISSYEDTVQPNLSTQFALNILGVGSGNSNPASNYSVDLGLSRKLGPIAFKVNMTPSIINKTMIATCIGYNAFSGIEMPKHWYRFTDSVGSINTAWSESGVLDCNSVGGCNEPNLTCHFKVDDSHMNSTEITTTIEVDTTPPTTNLISPANNSLLNNSDITFEYNTTDKNGVVLCELLLNNISINSTINPPMDQTLNFTLINISGGYYGWQVLCTDSIGTKALPNESEKRNFAYVGPESFLIENIGATGFESVNNDYTSSRLVILQTQISMNASCRYKNEIGDWSGWATCEDSTYWTLTEGDGNKTVTVEIDHGGSIITTYNDWIILESAAVHVDNTPPQQFNVYDDGNYTNKNETFHATWDDALDPETMNLNGIITYQYILIDNTTGQNITSWQATNETEITLSSLSLIEGHTYILNVSATNPANLTTYSNSDGIIADFTIPTIASVESNHDTITWSNNNTIYLNWTATDTLSGVKYYSMILDEELSTDADEIPETDYASERIYNKTDGIYYFHIRPIDEAGNPGVTSAYGPIMIDSTPPTKPVPTDAVQTATSNTLEFNWQDSTDALSGVKQYNITIVENDTSASWNYTLIDNNYTFTLATPGRLYFIIITAIDNAGNYIASDTPSLAPLQIIYARPDGGAVVYGEPIIKVETNKDATCKESFTGKEFLFTGQTYHETKIRGGSPLTITCTDPYGYSAEATITYTLRTTETISSVAIGAINDTFVGQTVIVPITINSIGQVPKEKIMVTIDAESYDDFTITDIDDAGEYELRFIAKESGSQTIDVDVEGNADTEQFMVRDLTLNVEYSGSSPVNSETNLVYTDVSGKKAGLAGESKNVITGDFNINITDDGKTYIFFTKEFNSDKKNDNLKDYKFSKTTNTFGYAEQKDYNVKTSVDYDTLGIQGLKELTPGIYSLFIKNAGQDRENKTIIIIELE